MSSAISKSSFLAGSQCPKLLWKKCHEREAFPPVDPGKQAIFDQGHAIGELAKSCYPGGIEVAAGVIGHEAVIAETAGLLDRRVPLYEAAFAHEGGFARVDLLIPDGDEGWRVVEVKSGSKVKEQNLVDVAFQLHVCRGAGLTITGCALIHVNNCYVRHGQIIPEKLLIEQDITEGVEALVGNIPARLAEMRTITEEATCPEVTIGPQCKCPHPCDLREQCWAFLPTYPVTDLYRDHKHLGWSFLEAGVEGLADIPDPKALTAKQQVQVLAAKKDAPRIDRKALAAFLGELAWPLAYFDIESTSTAVPLYECTKPFEQTPFQFSLHIQDEPGGPLRHEEFLAEGQGDPRPAFLEKLRSSLPPQGSVIVYNASFESSALSRCAAAYPKHGWAAEVPSRMLDLLRPFREFSYHHRDQHGSASIKRVLPALTGTDYGHLAIQDGQSAARSFVTTEFTNLAGDRRDQLRRDLLAYCALDTMAMVEIVAALQRAK